MEDKPQERRLEVAPMALHKNFEEIKRVDANGYEYWEARELMSMLGYATWEKFNETVKRGMVAGLAAQQPIEDHFRGAVKMIKIAKNTKKEAVRGVVDYHLSRLACYLIAQNGDSRKPEIAFAQTYFAVQTRKQELFESMDDEGKRIFTRNQVAAHNNRLFESAKDAGVNDFGRFNNEGYLGLYGLTADGIRRHKGIGDDNLLDRAGSAELAANLFRITQTDEKLRNDAVKGEANAGRAHREVGRQVRDAITKIGGTMPEDLKPEEHIRTLIRRKVGQLPPPASARIAPTRKIKKGK